MVFQFFCPQEHLLEADLSQIGQQCMCPYCRSIFLVPEPARAVPIDSRRGPPDSEPRPPVSRESSDSAPPPADRTAAEVPAIAIRNARTGRSATVFPEIRTEPGSASDPSTTETAPEFPGKIERELPPVLHILCPSGHELETPREMLGQDALCPFCRIQFPLRYEDSLEHREQKALERQRREEALARAWVKWSIVAAAVVVIGVIVMIGMAVQM